VSPIEDYLDDLLRRMRADARTTRRLLDEASDHLHAAAAEFEAAGMAPGEAEREAVRRFGPVEPLVRATWRRSFGALVLETLRAGVLLSGCGLVAVGISGVLALLMNLLFGDAFVGAPTVAGTGGSTIAEGASDAVVLRVLAGVVGLLLVAAYRWLPWWRRTPFRVLPPGLVDALGAAAFAAGGVLLTGASVDQAVRGSGADGVGFFLSGAVVALAAAVVFCVRATRSLLPSR
jgi:hypothetical protein